MLYILLEDTCPFYLPLSGADTCMCIIYIMIPVYCMILCIYCKFDCEIARMLLALLDPSESRKLFYSVGSLGGRLVRFLARALIFSECAHFVNIAIYFLCLFRSCQS